MTISKHDTRVIPLENVKNAFHLLEPRTELRKKYKVYCKLIRTYNSSTRMQHTVCFDWFDYVGDTGVIVRSIHPQSKFHPQPYSYVRLKRSVQQGVLMIVKDSDSSET